MTGGDAACVVHVAIVEELGGLIVVGVVHRGHDHGVGGVRAHRLRDLLNAVLHALFLGGVCRPDDQAEADL